MKLIIGGRVSEVNIQAEFYSKCKENNINCYLGYKKEDCIFDAVVYDHDNNIYAIIEIKSYKTERPPKTNTKQISKYKKFGVPIFMIGRMSQIDSVICELKNYPI